MSGDAVNLSCPPVSMMDGSGNPSTSSMNGTIELAGVNSITAAMFNRLMGGASDVPSLLSR